MTNLTREIWGRELDIRVSFEDLDDKGIDEKQWDALGRIISEWRAVEESVSLIKDYYCQQNSQEHDKQADDNVFRYVMPKYLFIPQGSNERTVALMCDYRFDPENGLAVVFENEKFKEIGPQDIIL